MASHPPVLVLGYSEAAMLLRSPGDLRVRAVLAIHGQREFAVDPGRIEHFLSLQFDDVEAPNRTDPLHAARLRLRAREIAEFGISQTPPTLEHAASIIEFARAVQLTDGVLLCHCGAGVSRSPAAALLCMATWTGPGHERHCVEHLRTIRPCALPHGDLVAFGDELLGRNGRLVEAAGLIWQYQSKTHGQ